MSETETEYPPDVVTVQKELERLSGVEINPGKISVMKQAHDMERKDGQQRGRNRPTRNRYSVSFMGETEHLEEIEFCGDPKRDIPPDFTKLRKLLRPAKAVEQAPRLASGEIDTGPADTGSAGAKSKKPTKKEAAASA